MQRVWMHAQVKGHVWLPYIEEIGKPKKEKFREGKPLWAHQPVFPELRSSVDWYWTPAVSNEENRRAPGYPSQRLLWADCDEGYDNTRLLALKPTYLWETSPGHKQAIWLLSDSIEPSEFHRDGLMGLLIHTLGADRSGVDIGQLLRVPGSWHHKREAFQGRILRNTKGVVTRAQLLTRIARVLGFSVSMATEVGAVDPYGDRSRVLWRLAREAAELGISPELTFKLLRASQWNKWHGNDLRLKADIEKAYSQQPAQTELTPTSTLQGDAPLPPWGLFTVGDFGPLIHKPMRWILPGVIPEAGCGLLIAAPKVGKTRLAIELALGVATGQSPMGINVARAQNVGFFSLEDGEYLFAARLSNGLRDSREGFHWDGALQAKDQTIQWKPANPLPLFTRFDAIDLSQSEDKQHLLATILQYELKLVIIDTLSMAIGDHNVSNQQEMNHILMAVRQIARAANCAVLFIHHTRKRIFEKGETIQESILGATALHAWSEFVLSLAPPEDNVDWMRLGIQTKMGNAQYYLGNNLRIIHRTRKDIE